MTNLFLKEGTLEDIMPFIFMADKLRVFHDRVICIFLFIYLNITVNQSKGVMHNNNTDFFPPDFWNFLYAAHGCLNPFGWLTASMNQNAKVCVITAELFLF